jgi:hypothetical protein
LLGLDKCVLFTKYNQTDEIKDDDLGGMNIKHLGDEKYMYEYIDPYEIVIAKSEG